MPLSVTLLTGGDNYAVQTTAVAVAILWDVLAVVS